MSEMEDSDNLLLLTIESMWYPGYSYRKGKVTKTFKNFLKRRGLQSLVDWIEEKEMRDMIE